ncbi:MAG TPA: dephospho-CoA kinase [Ignavibacteriaceae bacterium]|nr:dephospho-CoA kinase [Ignavibacteriaceae bacterium]
MKKFKIAVTGNIGSGKSYFCRMIEEQGYPVVRADDISKEILGTDKKIREEVEKVFGKDSFVNDHINKKFLAEKIFNNHENVFKINSILHPQVIKKIDQIMNEALNRSDLVFVEAALIYEASMEEMFNYVVLITANEEIRRKRKVESGELSEEGFIKRNANQKPDEEKKKAADFVFENNGSIQDLENKALLLISILKGINIERR